MKNILTDEEQKEDFDRIANNYENWFNKARALHFSAKELFKVYDNTLRKTQKSKIGKVQISFFIGEQVLLLEGFAMECAFKGLYVDKAGKISENGKINIENHGKGVHNLVNLAKLADVYKDLDNKDKEILETLSLIIISYGCYPTPINYLVNPLKKTIETGFKPRYSWSDNDLIRIDGLITSIIGDVGDLVYE
jgi:hypothetical protein